MPFFMPSFVFYFKLFICYFFNNFIKIWFIDFIAVITHFRKHPFGRNTVN